MGIKGLFSGNNTLVSAYITKKRKDTYMKRTIILLLALILALFGISVYAKETLGEEMEIYDNTLRLHVPANSDSEEDQAVKLKVRDAVIDMLGSELSDCVTKTEAQRRVEELLPRITALADRVLDENGMTYKARASVIKEEYPRRDYGEITLPGGVYSSLKIELGEGAGQNWWCVLFPQICVGSAKPTEALAEVGFTPNQIRLITEKDGYTYVVKFKIVEILHSMIK